MAAAKTPRKMGHYYVKETLGEGGFSKVKLGVHDTTGEKVALKILKNKHALTPAIHAQVERECELMSKLKHKNTLAMLYVDWNAEYVKKNGKVQKVILIVLELATGGELFEFLSYTGSFEEPIARTYFQQLMEGVSFMHGQGVVHRDLKPENLLLGSDFTLKLADFGFANIISTTQSLLFTECGTPGYMAPEMITNSGYDAAATDLWACGVILFIMLAGFPPFQKPSTSDWWFNKLTQGKHALFWQAHCRNAVFGEEFKDFINNVLQPIPSKRFKIADMKAHAWWKGPVINDADLLKELTRRKLVVDDFKSRAAKEKKQAADVEAANLERGAVFRGDGDEDPEGLPPTMPTYVFKADLFKVPTVASGGDSAPVSMSDSDLVTLTSGSLGGTFGDMEDEKSAVPPPYDDATSACYTKFESKTDADDLLIRLETAIAELQGKISSLKRSLFKIKATFAKSGGSVDLSIQIYSYKDGNIVQFRRRKGESPDFREIYQNIQLKLQSVVFLPAE